MSLAEELLKERNRAFIKVLKERDEARDLARKMYQALMQFPTSISELIDDWPEEEPTWLWRTQ